jgi:hypothetical protein
MTIEIMIDYQKLEKMEEGRLWDEDWYWFNFEGYDIQWTSDSGEWCTVNLPVKEWNWTSVIKR